MSTKPELAALVRWLRGSTPIPRLLVLVILLAGTVRIIATIQGLL